MGNVAKDSHLSDLLFGIDLEHQHDEVSALLDNIPTAELESSLSNIDFNLFLGEDGADIPVDLIAEDSISRSSGDSDDMKFFFNGKKTIKTEPVSPEKCTSDKKSKKGVLNKKNNIIKQEILEDDEKVEAFSTIRPGRSIKVENQYEEGSSHQQDDSSLYNTHRKRGKKRKRSEYSKKKTKLNKNFKIVIKYKENPSEEPKAVVVSASTNSTSADDSPTYHSPTYNDHLYSPFGFSFADIPDSFSTSIAEKVKTRTRKRNSSSETSISNLTDQKTVGETTVKNVKKSPVATEKSAPSKNKGPCLSPNSVTYHLNKTKEVIHKKLLALKRISSNNNSVKQVNNVLKSSSDNVPSLSLIPCNDVLGITDNFINRNKKSAVNNNVIASKIKNFHDYSKTVPVNNKVIKRGKELTQSSLPVVPNVCKVIQKTLRSDTNHTSPKLKARRTSAEYIELLSSVQESNDVPVSMAEVEIASFEDAAIDTKSPYSLRNSHFSDSTPKKPVVLLTPINSKKLLNSEILKNGHCSTESEKSFHGSDSLSPSPPTNGNLFVRDRARRSGLKSSLEPDSQSDFMCNSKVNSLPDKFECDVPKDGNYDHFQSPQAKTRRISRLPDSPKKSAYSSNSLFSLRPSTRSQTKSPERPSQQINAKLKRVSNRLNYSEENRKTNDSRKLPFDNRKAIEERRVMYVGKIPNGFTEEILLQQFSIFGEIENIQIKIRESEAQNDCGNVVDHEYGDWSLMSSSNGLDRWKKMYGFVTFRKHSDVARAIEEGQKRWPELKLNFGGRREFVKVNYSDLDGNFAEKTGFSSNNDDFDFARELKAAQQRRGLAYK